MAYKVFSNGDALTGGELNTYLMNQSVIQFASTTARDAALPSPSEGQLVWLQDSNKYVYYSGSAWADLIVPAAGDNAIINGAFEINQRNFTSATSLSYGFDRWVNNTEGVGATFTAQTFTPGTAPVAGYEGKNFLQCATTGQSAAGTFTIFTNRMESVRTFAGQTVTISFWAKAASGTPKIAIELAQVFGPGGSAEVDTPVSAVTLSTSWTRYTATVAVPSITGKTIGTSDYLELNLWTSAGSDYSASRASSIGIQTATIGIWGVQVESGSTATAFKRNASNIQGELAACQRYYWHVMNGLNKPLCAAMNFASNQLEAVIQFPVTMRTAPSIVQTTGTSYYNFLRANANDQFNSLTIDQVTESVAFVYNASEISGTAGDAGFISGGNASSSFAFSAEL